MFGFGGTSVHGRLRFWRSPASAGPVSDQILPLLLEALLGLAADDRFPRANPGTNRLGFQVELWIPRAVDLGPCFRFLAVHCNLLVIQDTPRKRKSFPATLHSPQAVRADSADRRPQHL